MFRGLIPGALALFLVGCSGDDPGPLDGTWAATTPFPVTVTFRHGETEAMGVTKNVSYEISGDEVLVTYEEGATKGTTFRYTVVDTNTLRSDSGTFHRVR